MATIVTRSGKGSALSTSEMDANLTNLNTDKLENVVADNTPQLGGDLDVNGNDLVSTSNGAISLDPNGSGKVVFKGNSTRGAGQLVLNCEFNSHGITIKGPPHSASASYTLTLPNTDGNANEVLKTDGSGNLDWVAQPSSGIASLASDSTPQLGGDLDVQTNSIVSTSNANIDITPNGTGKVVVKRLQVSDGSDGNISVDVADGNLNLSAGSGTGVVNINSTTGIQVSADASNNANFFTASSSANIMLKPGASGLVISDKNHLLNTGNLVAASGTDLTLSTQGATDVIVLNQTGGVVVTDTGASGKGVITGATSKGVAIATNGGAQAGTDPIISLDSGGGATVSAGTSSALALVGATVGITGTTTVTGDSTVTGDLTVAGATDLDLLTNYVHDIQVATTSGTYAPDPSTGNVIYVIPQGNLTINDFASGAIEPGQSISLFIDQSSYSTSFTLTLGSNFILPGGTAPTLTATGNDLLTMTCLDDGTTTGSNLYMANFVADYQ